MQLGGKNSFWSKPFGTGAGSVAANPLNLIPAVGLINHNVGIIENKEADARNAENIANDAAAKDFETEMADLKARFKERMLNPGAQVRETMSQQENQAGKSLDASQRAGNIQGAKAEEAKMLLNRQYAAETARQVEDAERQTLNDYGKSVFSGEAAKTARIAANKSGQKADRQKFLGIF